MAYEAPSSKKYNDSIIVLNGIIDAVMYNQELNRMEKQNEESRREIQSLGNIESGLMLRETEKLLHFLEAADMLDAYNEELFTSFVDSIITIYIIADMMKMRKQK